MQQLPVDALIFVEHPVCAEEIQGVPPVGGRRGVPGCDGGAEREVEEAGCPAAAAGGLEAGVPGGGGGEPGLNENGVVGAWVGEVDFYVAEGEVGEGLEEAWDEGEGDVVLGFCGDGEDGGAWDGGEREG